MNGPLPPISAQPAAPTTPLTLAVQINIDDWTQAIWHASREVFTKQRRRLLTLHLPVIWLGPLLIILQHFATASEGRGFIQLLRDVFLEAPWMLPLVVTATVVILLASLPQMARRRIRHLLRANGFDAPIPVEYRFDANGITSSEPDSSSFIPWANILRMEETDAYLFFVPNLLDEPIVVPKRGLPEADVAQMRRYGEACVGQRPPAPEATTTQERTTQQSDSAINVRFALDVKDRAAIIMQQHYDRPIMQRRRLLAFVLWTTVLSLAMPTVYATVWFFDPDRVPLPIALPLYLQMFIELFWIPAVLIVMPVMVMLFFVQRLIRTQGARIAAANAMAAAQEGASDVHMTISDDGITTARAGVIERFDWSCFKAIEQAKDRIFLPVSRGSMLLLPRRALDEAQFVRFNTFVQRHLVAISGKQKAA